MVAIIRKMVAASSWDEQWTFWFLLRPQTMAIPLQPTGVNPTPHLRTFRTSAHVNFLAWLKTWVIKSAVSVCVLIKKPSSHLPRHVARVVIVVPLLDVFSTFHSHAYFNLLIVLFTWRWPLRRSTTWSDVWPTGWIEHSCRGRQCIVRRNFDTKRNEYRECAPQKEERWGSKSHGNWFNPIEKWIQTKIVTKRKTNWIYLPPCKHKLAPQEFGKRWRDVSRQPRINIRPGFMMELQSFDAITDKLKDLFEVDKPSVYGVRVVIRNRLTWRILICAGDRAPRAGIFRVQRVWW